MRIVLTANSPGLGEDENAWISFIPQPSDPHQTKWGKERTRRGEGTSRAAVREGKGEKLIGGPYALSVVEP